jgi:cob(I)alamin adenosyltransferase
MLYYSGKGDDGETILYSGKIVPKNDLTVELLGTIDTLNAHLGLAISLTEQMKIKKLLVSIQAVNSKVMSLIAGASASDIGYFNFEYETKKFEDFIQSFSKEIDPPQDFSYSGCTSSGALLDICRTFARKVERKVVSFIHENPLADKGMVSFYNRLSSLFYVLRLFIDQTV